MNEVKIIDSNFSKEIFNKIAKHPIQSWEWGNARQETGLEVIRFVEFVENEPVKSFTMTVHKLPYIEAKIGYIGMSWIPSRDVIEFLKKFQKDKNLAFIKIEPDYFTDNPEVSELNGIDLVKSLSPNFYKWTYVIDLSLDEKRLLANLKNTWRYNIGLARRKGIEIINEDNDEGFKTFLKVFMETTKRQNYSGHDEKYHTSVWNNLKDNISHILYAKYGEDVVAALELFSFNGTLYYPYGGSLPIHRQFKAPNLLVWEAMMLGKRLGATKFDMWGVAHPNEKDHEWASITEFKSGFGGELKELVGSFDLVNNQIIYFIYNLAFYLRKIIKKLRS